MKKLLNGLRRFREDGFPRSRELFEELASGQSPDTLLVSCADSRICPSLFTGAAPGELFQLRNAGNIVPPFQESPDGCAATVEYAVNGLKVRNIVVCGHSHCGAITGCLHPENLDGLPAVSAWLEHAVPPDRIASACGELTNPAECLEASIKENVLVQLEHLRTHPAVAAALAREELELHAWFYEFETGLVFTHQPTETWSVQEG